jgi:prolycopene isomerase
VQLFDKMIAPKQIPGDYLGKIDSLKPSISSFQVWLALNRDITDRIKDSHIFLVAASDTDKAFQSALQGNAAKASLGVCVYNNIYKDYSPPGTTVLSLIFITGYEPWERFAKGYWEGKKNEYHVQKKEIADTLIRRVEETLIPGLSKMIAVQDAATPLTNIRYTLNTQGAIYGFEQTASNSFMHRISNRTPIEGLYLAGAWGEPGGGYTGVLISGRQTFGMLMEDWGKV